MPATQPTVQSDTTSATAVAPSPFDTKTDTKSDAKTDAKANGNAATALVAVTPSTHSSTAADHKAVTVITKEDINATMYPSGGIETTICEDDPKYAADFKLYGGAINQTNYSQRINNTLSQMQRSKTIWLLNGAYNLTQPLEIRHSDVYHLVFEDKAGYLLDLNNNNNTSNLISFLQGLDNLKYLRLNNLKFHECNLSELLRIIISVCEKLKDLEIIKIPIKNTDLRLIKNKLSHKKLRIILDVEDYFTTLRVHNSGENAKFVKKYSIPTIYAFYKETCGTNITLEITGNITPALSNIKSWAEEEVALEKQIKQLLDKSTYNLAHLTALPHLVTRCSALVDWQRNHNIIDEPKAIERYQQLFGLVERIRDKIDNSISLTDKLAIYELLVNCFKQLLPHLNLKDKIDQCNKETHPIRLAIFNATPTLANFKNLAEHFENFLKYEDDNEFYCDTIDSINKMSSDDQLSALDCFPTKQKSQAYYAKYFELNIRKFSENNSENKFFEAAKNGYWKCSKEKQKEYRVQYLKAALRYTKNVTQSPTTKSKTIVEGHIPFLTKQLGYFNAFSTTNDTLMELRLAYSMQTIDCHWRVIELNLEFLNNTDARSAHQDYKKEIINSFKYLCECFKDKAITNVCPDFFEKVIATFLQIRSSGNFQHEYSHTKALQFLLISRPDIFNRYDDRLLTENILTCEDAWRLAELAEDKAISSSPDRRNAPVLLDDCYLFYINAAIKMVGSDKCNYDFYLKIKAKLQQIPQSSQHSSRAQLLLKSVDEKLRKDVDNFYEELISVIEKDLGKTKEIIKAVAENRDSKPFDFWTRQLLREAKVAKDKSDLNALKSAINSFIDHRGSENKLFRDFMNKLNQQAGREHLYPLRDKLNCYKLHFDLPAELKSLFSKVETPTTNVSATKAELTLTPAALAPVSFAAADAKYPPHTTSTSTSVVAAEGIGEKSQVDVTSVHPTIPTLQRRDSKSNDHRDTKHTVPASSTTTSDAALAAVDAKDSSSSSKARPAAANLAKASAKNKSEETRKPLHPDKPDAKNQIAKFKSEESELRFGEATDNDSFLDSVTQALPMKHKSSVESLRNICHKRACDDKNAENDKKSESPIPSEVVRNGRFLCEEFKISLHIIYFSDKESKHYFITSSGLDLNFNLDESFDEKPINYKDSNILHLAYCPHHFVPILSDTLCRQLYSQNKADGDTKNTVVASSSSAGASTSVGTALSAVISTTAAISTTTTIPATTSSGLSGTASGTISASSVTTAPALNAV